MSCGRRFTTFERLEEVTLMVEKRSGDRVPFDQVKITAGIRSACKNRDVDPQAMLDLAISIEDHARSDALEVIPSSRIGREVLEGLRELDQVAYLRFASVYKGFQDPADFTREVGLLTKATKPKRH